MSSGANSVLRGDWLEAAEACSHAVGFVSPKRSPCTSERALVETRRPDWHLLPEEEGVVRQHGSGSYLSVDQAEGMVRSLAEEIAASLSPAMAALDTAQVPPVQRGVVGSLSRRPRAHHRPP